MTEAIPSWIMPTKRNDVFRISVYAQPGATVAGLCGEFNGALKIKISSPPVDGAANDALIKFFAQKLGIKLRDISLIDGETSRKKTLEISGLKSSDICEKLLP